jgi:glycosyltransferase involved in cell wall biosynthesis
MNSLPSISIVINTFNEEQNLPFALRSVQNWASEIIVVDMHSDDSTVDIARQFGAKIYFYERLGFADPARAFAISQATKDWILILDADEIILPQLCTKLISIIEENKYDVIMIPRLNYFLGSPLKYSRLGPHQDKHARLFRKGCLKTSSNIHNFLHPLPNARIFELPYIPNEAIVHFNYINISHFIERMNRYTSIEAQQARARGEKATSFRIIFKIAKEFLGRYFIYQGYRDGWRGIYLSLFMVFYHLTTFAKLTELNTIGTGEEIKDIYHRQAEQWLDAYNNE